MIDSADSSEYRPLPSRTSVLTLSCSTTLHLELLSGVEIREHGFLYRR
jgi:hypothetical protein